MRLGTTTSPTPSSRSACVEMREDRVDEILREVGAGLRQRLQPAQHHEGVDAPAGRSGLPRCRARRRDRTPGCARPARRCRRGDRRWRRWDRAAEEAKIMCAVPAAGEVACSRRPAAWRSLQFSPTRVTASPPVPARKFVGAADPTSHGPRAASGSFTWRVEVSERSLCAACTLRAALAAALARRPLRLQHRAAEARLHPGREAPDEVKPGTDAQNVLSDHGHALHGVHRRQPDLVLHQPDDDAALRFMKPDHRRPARAGRQLQQGHEGRAIASYGLQDGVVFDFISRTTPTGGNELSLVRQLLRATGQGVI